MGQDKLYEISKMKDLSTIYFYDLAQSKSNGAPSFVGLRVTYDNNGSLGYEYNSEYFDTFLKKVIELYEEEKNNGKIKFFDEYSKETLETLIKLKESEQLRKKGCYKSLLNSESKYKVFDEVRPYVEKMITELLSYIDKSNITITDIKGIKDKYFVCLSNDGTLLISIIKKSATKYNFKANYTKDKAVYFIDGEIEVSNDYVDIEVYTDDDNIIYKCHYTIDKYLNENTIRENEKLVWFEEPDLSLDDNDTILIDFYSEKFLGSILENKIKTAPGHYILSGTNISGDRYVTTNLNMILTDDNVKMKYRIKKGIARKVENDYLYFPYFEEYGEKVLKHICDRNHNDFIVEETKIDPFMIQSVDLPKTLATYYYDLYKVEGFTTFTDSLPLIEKVDEDDDSIKHAILKNR